MKDMLEKNLLRADSGSINPSRVINQIVAKTGQIVEHVDRKALELFWNVITAIETICFRVSLLRLLCMHAKRS